jgi:hypothetical protein
MTTSYTYADILSIARPNIAQRGDDMFSATLCNMATEAIWNAYDWHETVEPGAAFYVVPGVQDYPFPLAEIPQSFYGFRRIQLVDIESGSASILQVGTVAQRRHLERTSTVGIPSLISYLPEVQAYRVWPRPSTGLPPTRYIIQYTYKKMWTRVQPDSLHTLLPLPDTLMPAFVLGLIWASAKLTIGNPQIVDSHYAALLREIQRKAEDYGLADGDVLHAPAEPLAGWDIWSPWNFYLP